MSFSKELQILILHSTEPSETMRTEERSSKNNYTDVSSFSTNAGCIKSNFKKLKKE